MGRQAGISLVDVIVGAGIFVLVFVGLFAAFQGAVRLAEQNRFRTTAVALANEHIERIRALPYDSIGTVAGLPPGNIPQVETITHNGVSYTKRVLIQYVDDPADGTGAGDTLAADYKRIKVELTYDLPSGPQSMSLVTTVAPKSQESLAGAGILRVNINDANNNPVQGASVHVLNTLVATSVDVTASTNASGTIAWPGAWAGAGYEVYVTKAGYSGAQTYLPTVANPNPSPSPLTVSLNSTTDLFLKIDRFATLNVRTQGIPPWGNFEDEFDNAMGLVSAVDTVAAGGTLSLSGSSGTYPPTGTAESVTFAPASLGSWLLVSFVDTKPALTSVSYRVYADTGSGFAPIPASDLPGNDVGFTESPIDLGVLDSATYPSLRVVATLTSSDPLVTPSVDSWRVSYLEPGVPMGNEQFRLTELTKSIGTNGGVPVLKIDSLETTDASGEWTSSTVEWGQYDVVPQGGLTVAEACPAVPLTINPDSVTDLSFSLVLPSAHTLSVEVASSLGGLIPRAEVTLSRAGVTVGTASGACGIAYFDSLTDDTYTLTARAPGHTEHSEAVAVSGQTTHVIVLSP